MKPGTMLAPKEKYGTTPGPDRTFGIVISRPSRWMIEVMWCNKEVCIYHTTELYRYKVAG